MNTIQEWEEAALKEFKRGQTYKQQRNQLNQQVLSLTEENKLLRKQLKQLEIENENLKRKETVPKRIQALGNRRNH